MAATSLWRQLHRSINGASIFQDRTAIAAVHIKRAIVFRGHIVRVLTKGLAEVNRVRAREGVNRIFSHPHFDATRISLFALAWMMILPLPARSQELPSLIKVV